MTSRPRLAGVGDMGPDSALTERIRRLFVDTLNIEVEAVDTDVIEGGLLDSLALVELLFQIEQQFQVDLSLDEL